LQEAVSLALIILTAAGLQVPDRKQAAWDTLQQAYVEGSTKGPELCLLGVVDGFNTCNYMYAVGAFGILLTTMCFMHHVRPDIGMIDHHYAWVVCRNCVLEQ
jgi:hypothetical protein